MSAQSDDDQIPNSENPNFTEQQHPENPQSLDPPKTLTLETPDSPHPQSPHLSLDDDDDGDCVPATAGLRRGGVGGGGGWSKRKKQKRRPAAERKLQEKLKYLSDNMKAVAFVPAKRLDFASREALLRRVGLWDFVNLEFDCSVRVDLVAELIASYSSDKRSSYVNGLRIGVNRADLARALKLPTRREKGSVQAGGAEGSGAESEDSVVFLEDFVSNWILLHGDAWIMPDEILNWIKMIKEGHFEKVDWAGMIWFMVEKELGAQQLTDCYYASHLQQLIKFQKEVLFEEGPSLEADVKDEVDVKDDDDEEEDGGADAKMVDAEGLQVQCAVEEKNIELSLGQENVEVEGNVKDDVMDFGVGRREETGHWLKDGKNDAGGHFMQLCDRVEAVDAEAEKKNLGTINEVDDEYNIEEARETHDVNDDDEEGDDGDEEVEEQDVEFQIMQKCDGLEGLSSSNLIQAMDAQNAFSSGVQFRDNLSNDFMLPRVDTDVVAGSSIFSDNGKRHADHVVDMYHHSLNGSNKRPRLDEPADFHTCMEQIENWVGKAKMIYEAKEQSSTHANMQQQAFMSEIQQRDAVIAQIHKARIEEQQKNQTQIHRYEHELSMMVGLLDGYKKALKETHRAFAEYRARCPLPQDEPLYKDVSGSGGLVLSTMELEKQRIKQEEEERMMRVFVENSINSFETHWLERFQGYFDILNQFENRLVGLDFEMKYLKESSMKQKVEASVCRAVDGSEFISTEHLGSKVAEDAEHNAPAEAADGNGAAEAADGNAAAEAADGNAAAEAADGNAAAESVDANTAAESADGKAAAEAVECDAPAEAIECDAPAEAVKCSNSPEGVDCSAPPQGMECNSPTDNMECSAQAEDMELSFPPQNKECNSPTENLVCSAVVEDVECNAPAEYVENSAPTDCVENSLPTEVVENSVASEVMENSAPAQNMECSIKVVQDIKTIEEQS